MNVKAPERPAARTESGPQKRFTPDAFPPRTASRGATLIAKPAVVAFATTEVRRRVALPEPLDSSQRCAEAIAAELAGSFNRPPEPFALQ